MTPIAHSETIHIAADHPALPGHFPGAPVVPGVVLLDHVVAAVQRRWKMRVVGLPQVKFLHPLKPGHAVQLTIEREDMSARFRVLDGAHVLASGLIEVGA
ncbi:MAG: hydroxymyristoyl-ACP dehydratase [Rudaea sp.]|nr:hydroxymyristoyl-ACP dehydratase [Rudaea sp.]